MSTPDARSTLVSTDTEAISDNTFSTVFCCQKNSLRCRTTLLLLLSNVSVVEPDFMDKRVGALSGIGIIALLPLLHRQTIEMQPSTASDAGQRRAEQNEIDRNAERAGRAVLRRRRPWMSRRQDLRAGPEIATAAAGG
jgi:hypothetical protein